MREHITNRITVNKKPETIDIYIRSHNSLLNAFILLFIMNFFITLLIGAFMAAEHLAFIFNSTLGAENWVYTVLKIYAVFAVLVTGRTFLWTLSGGEYIQLTPDAFIYKKYILRAGKTVFIKKDSLEKVLTENYFSQKDILERLKSEIPGKADTIKIQHTGGALNFGIFLSVHEADVVEKTIKNYYKMK
ncbi:MAG: hypothetical protein ACLFP1_08515 [Candidatus Goldiibacteriota bacterium]